MVNTADLKSAPLRVIGSIPIVSRVKSFENLKASSLHKQTRVSCVIYVEEPWIPKGFMKSFSTMKVNNIDFKLEVSEIDQKKCEVWENLS